MILRNDLVSGCIIKRKIGTMRDTLRKHSIYVHTSVPIRKKSFCHADSAFCNMGDLRNACTVLS